MKPVTPLQTLQGCFCAVFLAEFDYKMVEMSGLYIKKLVLFMYLEVQEM